MKIVQQSPVMLSNEFTYLKIHSLYTLFTLFLLNCAGSGSKPLQFMLAIKIVVLDNVLESTVGLIILLFSYFNCGKHIHQKKKKKLRRRRRKERKKKLEFDFFILLLLFRKKKKCA